jgi:hypothetical protein
MKLTFLFILIFTCVNISLASIKGEHSSDCKPISECELCQQQGGGQPPSGKNENGCEETGRHRKWSCNEEGEDIIEYRSCKRTTIEEEYNVVRFEILCLLISLVSLKQVRKEKLLNESLFDKLQRQAKVQQQQQQQRGKTSMHEQEMIALVSSTTHDCQHSDDNQV